MTANYHTPRYLGPEPHPAIGVRIPEIFLGGILSAYKMRRTAGGLMLSCSRETAPQYVINALPGEYSPTLGHTGSSIRDYILKSSEMARKDHALVEIEADHLIVGSDLHAVQRILGDTNEIEMTDEQISTSLSFVFDAIDEAVSTGSINSFTVDTTDLVDLNVGECSKAELNARFQTEIDNGRALLEEYSRDFSFSWIDGSLHRAKFSQDAIMRMALQFKRSLDVSSRIYSFIRKKMVDKPFGFELTFDELPKPTGTELAYFLREWRKLGAHVDFVAPNIGFKKRTDFNGDLQRLKEELSSLAAVAHGFGALLSIHSGSGTSPYSGKGRGVYEATVEATYGRVKYKVSGIYFELIMDLLARSRSARYRKLFGRIFGDVLGFWEDQVDKNTPLADTTLRKMLLSYKAKRKAGHIELDCRSNFFRHYSFISLNLRDGAGNRYLKDELLESYGRDARWRNLVDKEVKKLTLRLIDGINYANNFPLN